MKLTFRWPRALAKITRQRYQIGGLGSVGETVGPEFFAQRAPVDAQNSRCLTLVTAREVQNGFKKRLLHLVQDEIVKLPGIVAVEMAEICIKRLCGGITQRNRAGRAATLLPFASGLPGSCHCLVTPA